MIIPRDDRPTLSPYDAGPQLSSDAARHPGLVAPPKPLIGRIDVNMLRYAHTPVDIQGRLPTRTAAALDRQPDPAAAEDWPVSKGEKGPGIP